MDMKDLWARNFYGVKDTAFAMSEDDANIVYHAIHELTRHVEQSDCSSRERARLHKVIRDAGEVMDNAMQ